MSNFSINTSVNMGDFNNSVNEFNKIFNNSVKETNKAFSNTDKEFQEIFNSMSAQKPLEAGVQYQIGGSINAQKVENLSPTAKMASDIGQGLKNGFRELSNVQRDAENKAELFAAGGDVSIHDVMISAKKSTLAMQMAIQLRNQVLDAYNQLRNMSV